MVRSRAGRSSLGCLVALLLVVALIYFGVKVGEVYWRAYEFKDAMRKDEKDLQETKQKEV